VHHDAVLLEKASHDRRALPGNGALARINYTCSYTKAGRDRQILINNL